MKKKQPSGTQYGTSCGRSFRVGRSTEKPIPNSATPVKHKSQGRDRGSKCGSWGHVENGLGGARSESDALPLCLLVRHWGRIRVQFSDGFAIGSGPGEDLAFEVGGEDLFGVFSEGDAEGKVAGVFHAALFAPIGIPEGYFIAPAASDELAIVTVCHAECASAVRRPIFGLFALLHFPEFDVAILAGRGEQFGIAT